MKDWLVVREIFGGNIARHWTESRHRFCVLENGELLLKTSDTVGKPVSEYSLRCNINILLSRIATSLILTFEIIAI